MNALASPSLAASAARPDRAWHGFLRRGARNLLVCLLIGLLLWALSPEDHGGLLISLVYSMSIGTLCWFFIDGSRLLLARWLYRRRPDAWQRSARWPGPAWMVICILGGTVLGYSIGATIGDALTGYHIPSLVQNRGAVLVSLIAAVAATAYFYANERLHEERAAAESARRLAAESQLKLLESQLEPHMLFNTLANLRVLIGIDPARAQAMLDHLIAYLRATLQASRAGAHSLAAEFERLADYLALMTVRMGPRLAIQFDLPEDLRALPVPPLLLQPLVENAIRHGLEPKVDGGRLHVGARAEGGNLVLVVRDTGVGGTGAATSAGAGYGLAHVRERLAVLYGDRAGFTLEPADDAEGGTRAELRLPIDVPTTAPTQAATA